VADISDEAAPLNEEAATAVPQSEWQKPEPVNQQYMQMYNTEAKAHGVAPEYMFGPDGQPPAQLDPIAHQAATAQMAGMAADAQRAMNRQKMGTDAQNAMRAQAGLPPLPGSQPTAPDTAVQHAAAPIPDQPQSSPSQPFNPYADVQAHLANQIGYENKANDLGLQGNLQYNREALPAIQSEIQGLQDAHKIYQDTVQPLQQKMADVTQGVADQTIQHNRVWANMSTGNRILAGVSILLGGIGQGLLKSKSNAALDAINENINRDVADQRAEMDKKNNLYKMYLGQTQNAEQAEALTKAHLLAVTQGMMALAAIRSNDPKAQAAYMQNKATIEGQLGQYAQQIAGMRINGMLNTQEFPTAATNLVPENERKLLVRTGPDSWAKATSEKGAEELNTKTAATSAADHQIQTLKSLARDPSVLVPGSPANLAVKQSAAGLLLNNAMMQGLQASSRNAELLQPLMGNPASIRQFIGGSGGQLLDNLSKMHHSSLQQLQEQHLPAKRQAPPVQSFKPSK
jgi:hypothetical protein